MGQLADGPAQQAPGFRWSAARRGGGAGHGGQARPLPPTLWPAALYATWAHEAIHSSGHSSRLARDLSGGMGDGGDYGC
jgi:hypothetical protein